MGLFDEVEQDDLAANEPFFQSFIAEIKAQPSTELVSIVARNHKAKMLELETKPDLRVRVIHMRNFVAYRNMELRGEI